MSQKQKIEFLLIVGMLLIIILSIFYSMRIAHLYYFRNPDLGIELFCSEVFGEYAVAVGTILLALFTYVLAHGETEKSRKERRRLRLKEQLEKFYSPLMGEIGYFFNEDISPKEKIRHFYSIISLYKIKSIFEFLASNDLREELRMYFVGGKIDIEEINNLRDIIYDDFKSLSEEYSELTEKK